MQGYTITVAIVNTNVKNSNILHKKVSKIRKYDFDGLRKLV